MKKLVLILAVMMMAAPVMADIVITIDNSVYPAEVKYEKTGGTTRARAFALDIVTDDTADINNVTDLSADFWVHPGGINIVGGVVEQDGNAWADPCTYEGTRGGFDTNGVTIEMASLYKGAVNAPPDSGVLCSFTVTSACLVSITENTIRGGVVLEDTNSATAVLDLSGATNVPVGPVGPTHCPGDWNHDGTVTLGDLMAMISAMAPTYGDAPPASYYNSDGDWNNDGTMTLGDLMAFISAMAPTYGDVPCP